MTRRERLEARLQRRTEWAAKRKASASRDFTAARAAVDGIPPGQPILVGHHSEAHHRAALERHDSAMRRACESADMASHHASRADGISRQLQTSIFSDDPDAIEALRAKLATLEAEREHMSAANRAYRKGDAAKLAELGFPDLEALRREVESRYSWERKGPFAPYQLSNLGGRITATRKRIEYLTEQAARVQSAQAHGVDIQGEDYVRVTFPEYSGRATVDAMRGGSFTFSGGSWFGRRENLPASVRKLAGICPECGGSVDADGYCEAGACPESCAVTATCQQAETDWPKTEGGAL